jgi:hypothetical protein
VSATTQAEFERAHGLDERGRELLHRVFVKRAVEALQTFGGHLSREEASMLLSMWQHRESLTPRDAADVPSHFRPKEEM